MAPGSRPSPKGRSCSGVLLAAALLLGVLALPTVGPAYATALPANASQYVAVAPVRLADTRASIAFGFTSVSSSTIRVAVASRAGTPTTPVAAVLNVTVIGSAAAGYATVYPAGSPLPATSNVNADAPGRTVANLVHVQLGVDGSVDIFRSTGMDLAIDLVGVYVPVTGEVGGGRLVTLAQGAQRAIDTRQRGFGLAAGWTETVDLSPAGLPQGASAALVTVTVVDGNPGFWTAFPSGTARPWVSTVNIDKPAQTRAAQAIVPLSGTTTIDVYSESGGQLIVDLAGWYTGDGAAPSSDGLFVPTQPLRMLDTRRLSALAPWGGSTFEVATGSPTPGVAAVAMNLTATDPWDNGFVTAYPAGLSRPLSSNLNISAWPQTIANHSIVRASNRGVSLFTSNGTHLIADVFGWFLGAPSTATLPAPANPTYSPSQAVALYVGKIGLYVGIRSGSNLDAIANTGYAAAWNDQDEVGTPGNVMLFGHRTKGNAPFRYVNRLHTGDEFVLIGADGHWYHYRVTEARVTLPSYDTITSIATRYAPMTAQLVACSRLDGTPTSLLYRISITGRLVAIT